MVLLNAARPSLLTTKMRPSRGMGAIAPSKVPKLIKKRDGDEPVKVFKQGGKVNEAGKQFVKQPKGIAQKTSRFR